MNFLKRIFIKDSIIPFNIQDKKTWAVLFGRYEEVPEEYKVFYTPLYEKGEPFPYSIFVPAYDNFGIKSPELILCLLEQTLYIIHKNEPQASATHMKFENIQYLQFRTVLLDSYLRVAGTSDAGEPIISEIKFNSVSDFLFKKIVKIIRQSSFQLNDNENHFSFDEFRAESFKFANFSQHSLVPGEKVIQLIWQPELMQRYLHLRNPFFNHSFFRRRVFANHVLMLTDQELIHITEDNHYAHDDRYGGIWEYFSLSKIKNIQLKEEQGGLLTLSVILSNDEQFETRYLPSQKNDLENIMISINH